MYRPRILQSIAAGLLLALPLAAQVWGQEPMPGQAAPAQAQQPPVARKGGTEALIELLKAKGLISDEEAAALLQRARQEASEPPAAAQSPQTITISPADKEQLTNGVAKQIQNDVQDQVKAALKEAVIADAKQNKWLPDWVQRIRIGGDMRLRYQGEFFSANNAAMVQPSSPGQLMNTQVNQNLPRIRVRVTVAAQVNEQVDTAVTLLAGNDTIPISDQNTLGNYWNFKQFLIQEAYVNWHPNQNVTVMGGKMPNPFLASDLIFDPDVRPEGLAAIFKPQLTSRTRGFLTAGIFPLQITDISTTNFAPDDKWMWGGQVGAETAPSKNVLARVGVGYYSYQNVTGVPNSVADPHVFDQTAPQFQQKGNTLFYITPPNTLSAGDPGLLGLAGYYKELEFIGNLDLAFFDPHHVTFLFDWVKNIGFDRAHAAQLVGNPGLAAETIGYQAGLQVGYLDCKQRGNWKLFGYYKYLQADAVLDAFTDSDFHLGGTNAKGWILGGQLGLGHNVWTQVRWFSADQISGPPLAIDVLQVDLGTWF